MATTISTQDIIDAKRDIDDIGKAVNENVIVDPRYGADFKSLPMIAAEAQGTINEWQAAINTIVVNGGVPALAVSNANGETQQAINDYTGAKWRNKAGGYDLNARVMLDNGDIVQSVVAGNAVDPNVDMTGWELDQTSTKVFSELAALVGSSLIGYKQLQMYRAYTAGWGLNLLNGTDVHLLEFVPVEEHAAIYNYTSTYDAKDALSAAIAEAITKKATLVLPAGRITYSAIPNIKEAGFQLIGQGSGKTELNYTGTGKALSFDAFIDGGASDPFVNGLRVEGFHIKGSSFIDGLYAQGVARSYFSDIKVNGSSTLDGTSAFRFEGVMLSVFNNLMTSYVWGDTPYRGIYLLRGVRAGVGVNGCSNNVFISCYAEGNSIGWTMAANGGDQNTFIGGSPEANKVYSQLIGSNCRYNTFIGVGYESKDATSADVLDNGLYNTYRNCYAIKFIVGSTSKNIKVESGVFSRFEIQSGARATIVDQISVKQWYPETGGFFDNGIDTDAKRIIDASTGLYINTLKPRTGITVGASPFTYTNDKQIPVKIRVLNGTVTQVRLTRGADSWNEPLPSDGGSLEPKIGVYLLAPGESIQVSYTAAPTMNLIPFSI